MSRENAPVILLFVIAILTPIITGAFVVSTSDSTLLSEKSANSMFTVAQTDLARVLIAIPFPMAGVMTFVLGQAVPLRGKYAVKYGDKNHPKKIGYTIMCATSIIAIIECVITVVISLQCFFRVIDDMWLVGVLCLLTSVLVLLAFNAVLFYIYAMKD